jgi:hypothetical protein
MSLREWASELESGRTQVYGVGGNRTLDQRIKSQLEKWLPLQKSAPFSLRTSPESPQNPPYFGDSLRDMPLNERRVHIIRTSGQPDAYWARIWRVDIKTVRNARIGESWREHETPPDTKPRAHRGNWGDLE